MMAKKSIITRIDQDLNDILEQMSLQDDISKTQASKKLAKQLKNTKKMDFIDPSF